MLHLEQLRWFCLLLVASWAYFFIPSLVDSMFCRDRVNILLYPDVPSMIRCLHLKGICAHVDLMRFEDGIAIVSLESSCVMHFTQVGEVSDCGKEQPELPMIKIPVFLVPGSLVLLSGDARYLWKHEINRKPGFQMWEGQEVNQERRTSVTLRKLCHAE